ncbi:hypothetical protein BDZ45DRAFT_739570 [Acephala macrosclerotiorum]|nr:hypothetical protein BDZ45DRAFT_739570 [Acephala macrosclerotiorum]
MAFYQGWSLDGMRRSSSEFNQDGTLKGKATDRPISSFTPINPIAPAPQFISPQKTLHKADVYDIVEFGEDPPALLTAKPKKSRGQLNKGRAVSVNPLWEYVNEGDLAGQNNGNDFQTTLPKRRKPAATKRTSSLKALANTPSQFWLQDEEQVAGLKGSVGEQPGSQLTTPPDSGNKKRKRAASAKAQPSKPKMGPFKAPTITKPEVPRQKETAQEPIQAKTITCLGHTTSQDQVKLSQTTMERLKSFRYIPQSATQQIEKPTNAVQNPQSQTGSSAAMNAEPDGALLEDEVNGNPIFAYNEFHKGDFNDVVSNHDHSITNDQEIANVAFKHNLTPGNNAFFADAMWNVEMSNRPQYSGRTEEEQHPVGNPARDQTIIPEKESNDQPKSQDKSPNEASHLSTLVQQIETYPLARLPKITVQPNSSHTSSQYDEPDSSQTRAMLILSGMPQSAHLSRESLFERSSQGDIRRQANPDTPRILSGTDLAILDDNACTQHQEPSSQVLPILRAEQQKVCPNPSKNIQVESSDIDDIDMATEDVSKDYDVDDYDEGLDDSDLMELMTQPVVPATQPVMLPNVNSSLSLEQLEAEMVEHRNSKSNLSSPDDIRNGASACSLPTSSDVPRPEVDDEFPLDQDLEEEMMNLAESDGGIVECHQPSASLQHISEGFSSGEVYDKSLQFSPPKSKPTAQSPINTGGRHTDKDRGIHSPSYIPELPVEEDWFYIRSGAENHTGRSQRSNPRGASLKEIEEVSPTRSQAKSVPPALRTQSSTGQMTTTKITTILDDSYEYEPLKPFARPDFPVLIRDRSPVVGLSPQTFLRVCFRVAEMLKEGARCNALKEDAIIELFARVTNSSREPGTSRQQFRFADLWHDRPPFPNGILTNYSSSVLADTESKIFQRVGQHGPMMARCFGRLKRDSQNTTGWLLDIINIRTTDWEEIRWTKRIVSAGVVKSEKH